MKPFLPWLGVFETLRVEAGRALLLEEHLASLAEACAAVGLPLPDEFAGNLRAKAARLPGDTGRWRWVVDSDGGRALFSHEEGAGLEGYRVRIAPERVGAANWDARFKTFSYLVHWQARKGAEAAGFDEALLLNEDGHLASGAMTNLFWTKGGRLFTPAHEAGCRKGAVRRWLTTREQVEEGRFAASVLDEADEVFLTNSWIGIRPVVRVGERELSPGPIARALAEAYRSI